MNWYLIALGWYALGLLGTWYGHNTYLGYLARQTIHDHNRNIIVHRYEREERCWTRGASTSLALLGLCGPIWGAAYALCHYIEYGDKTGIKYWWSKPLVASRPTTRQVDEDANPLD